jgi:tetratricopeptide (TPR) repeat protein
MAFSLVQEPEDAIESFERAIELDPDNVSVYLGLGGAYITQEDYAKAIAAFTQATKIDSKSGLAHIYLGFAYCDAGYYEKAEESYKRALQFGPTISDYSVNVLLARVYSETKQYQKAIDACRQALAHEPDHDKAHYQLGLAYLQSGAIGSAMEQYERLKKLNGDLANNLLGFIRKRLDETASQAVEQLSTAYDQRREEHRQFYEQHLHGLKECIQREFDNLNEVGRSRYKQILNDTALSHEAKCHAITAMNT